jgi:hypothetical protein
MDGHCACVCVCKEDYPALQAADLHECTTAANESAKRESADKVKPARPVQKADLLVLLPQQSLQLSQAHGWWPQIRSRECLSRVPGRRHSVSHEIICDVGS